jgi:hypothetical protein
VDCLGKNGKVGCDPRHKSADQFLQRLAGLEKADRPLGVGTRTSPLRVHRREAADGVSLPGSSPSPLSAADPEPPVVKSGFQRQVTDGCWLTAGWVIGNTSAVAATRERLRQRLLSFGYRSPAGNRHSIGASNLRRRLKFLPVL